MTANSGRIIEVFTEANQLPVEERDAFLDRACADDDELRQRIGALLSSNERAGGFLEQPPGTFDEARDKATAWEKPGDTVDRYKLLEQIGEGGCGVVFLAEQQGPVLRRVALKVVKPGMDTKSVIARFEVERQALALMDHSGIAHVFDAGATERGRPYFVMELVDGLKITDYCDRHSLPVGARLELFIQVCDAIQHAHQKGIIHRDIKPSNIIVTTGPDGKAVPKVIDFGIAKATAGQRLTDKTIFTECEMLIGTPAYMSPEQVAFASADADTRTDVYSLGVLLYELLTGTTPFDARELLKSGLDEIRRVILDQEPVRPSSRLSTMLEADLTTVGEHRQAEPPRLIRAVRGDLDWIVMKALEKDRTRRFETANGLALDVKRFLANETVSARPPGKLYKFKKAMQRNKLLSAGIGIIAALIVISLAVVTASLGNERRARLKAQTEQARSRQATQFLKNMLEGVGPSVARGRNTEMLREILDKTVQEIGGQLGDQPTVEAEMRGFIGRLYFEIGNYAGAEAMARATLDLLQRKLRDQEGPAAAAALNDLGGALWKQRKLTESEAAYAEALSIRRRLFGNEHADVATVLNNLGAVYRRQKKLAESEALTRESLAIRRRLFGNEHLGVAESLRNLAIILIDRGQRAEAEGCAREMLAIRRRLLGADHPLVALALVDLAWVLGQKLPEAERLEMEAFEIQWTVLGDEHPDLVRSIYLRGERMRHRGELVESHAVLNAALSLQRNLLGDDHPDVLVTRRALSSILQQEGKWAEVEGLYRQALELKRKHGGGEESQAISEIKGLVHALREQKKLREAEQVLGEVLTPAFMSNPASVEHLRVRVDLMGRLGRWEDAAADLARCIKHQPNEHSHYHLLAPLLVVTRNRTAYDELCRKILVTFADTSNPYWAERMVVDCLLQSHPDVDLNLMDKLADTALLQGRGDSGALPFFQTSKAMAGYRLKRYTDAVTWAEKALEKTAGYTGAHTCAILAMAHGQLGHQAEAGAMLAKGETLAPNITPEHGVEKFDGSWVAWLIARIALDEAAAIIHSKPPEKSGNKP